MPPFNSPRAFYRNEQSSFASASAQEHSILQYNMMLLKQSIVRSPLRDQTFDPEELMNMDLIKTPQSYIEHLPDEFIDPFQDEKMIHDQPASRSSIPASLMISTLDPPRRMICHEDFPLLLAIRKKNRVRTNPFVIKQPTKGDVDATVMAMKQRRGLQNFTIFRGQCASTDQLMRKYVMDAMTKTHPDGLPDSDTMRQNQLFSSKNQVDKTSVKCDLNDDLKNSDLVTWAEDFFKRSCEAKKLVAKDGLVQKEDCTEAELLRNVHIASKVASAPSPKVNNEAGYLMKGKQSRAEISLGRPRKRRRAKELIESQGKDSPNPICSSFNTKLPVQSKQTNPSASSPSQTINSGVAIALTPHPFKSTKTVTDELGPPLGVTVEVSGPLSEMPSCNSKSSIEFRRGILGVPVPTHRNLKLHSGQNKSLKIDTQKRAKSSEWVTLEPSIQKPKLATIKEEIAGSKSFEELDEDHTSAGKENGMKTIDTQPLPILSVTFS
eukprot:jgi/Psemu1/1678/gm1.1678_g